MGGLPATPPGRLLMRQASQVSLTKSTLHAAADAPNKLKPNVLSRFLVRGFLSTIIVQPVIQRLQEDAQGAARSDTGRAESGRQASSSGRGISGRAEQERPARGKLESNQNGCRQSCIDRGSPMPISGPSQLVAILGYCTYCFTGNPDKDKLWGQLQGTSDTCVQVYCA